MSLTLADFVARWKASTLKERSAAQSHFIDLCEVLGERHPAAADQEGTFYTFEKGAAKAGGGEGFADVWLRGHFAWEYKGKHKNMEEAYRQLQQYRESLENPPLLVVCDLERFDVHTNFTNTVSETYSFTLDDLLTLEPVGRSALSALDILRAVFSDYERLRPQQTASGVTERAASEFAKLAESLRKWGHDPEEAAHFLMRLLFCLFAEDIGLLPSHVFSKLVENTRTRPTDFNRRIGLLFSAMATGGSFGEHDVAYFNGGLFDDAAVLDLTSDDLAILGRAAKLDWSSIEPAIFGTLFERSLDPSKRSQLGAHYTSREDILLIVEPVLMQPLRRRWEEVQAEAGEIIARRDATQDRGARTKALGDLQRLLVGFAEEISHVRVLDPACGSGNFLYVALKRLLDIEKEVSIYAASNGLSAMFPHVSPSQLYGIELNPYAHALASVVVWIGYIQWLHDNGFGIPSTPILQPLHNILQMDAILAYDEQGRPVEPEWPQADVIIGNPPFLGGSKLRRELGDVYTDNLFTLYRERVPATADLVCYWFERARERLSEGKTSRCGLLATQGIRGGANRKVLQRIKNTGDIFWAQSDRNWTLDGATVHVSMIGFDNGKEQIRNLDDRDVSAINPDLTAAANLASALPLVENIGLCLRADEKGGPFDISEDVARTFLEAPVNVNGQLNSDVVRPWTNGQDLMRRSRGMWIIDFYEMSLEEASQYELPFNYVLKEVYPERQQNKEERTRTKWWLHRRPGTDMRNAIAPLARYIATSYVSKHRVFIWLSTKVLADATVVVIARQDDYFLGALQSRTHELWARGQGTQLREAESGSRYTPTTTFETYPFPWPPGEEPHDDPRVEAIGQAARELVEKRDRWLNPEGASEAELKRRTLTNLYNERPTWLQLAHKRLDEAVLDAYGWAHDVGDEEILARLLALNLERGGGG